MNATDTEGDDLIAQMDALYDRIRAHAFPALTVEKVTDDGETFDALRCPRCGAIVSEENLYAVDISERWTTADLIGDEEFIHQVVKFQFDGDEDYGDTVYYRHDDHAVDLPDGWREQASW